MPLVCTLLMGWRISGYRFLPFTTLLLLLLLQQQQQLSAQ